jgi:hypothetical protein
MRRQTENVSSEETRQRKHLGQGLLLIKYELVRYKHHIHPVEG